METEDRVRRRHVRASEASVSLESELDLKKLLRALQAVRDGDFSVRLPSDQTGLAGKVADTFNEIVASNQRMAREIERAGQMVGKEGKTRHRVGDGPARRRLGRDGSLGEHADRRPAVADNRSDAHDHRRREGRPVADRAAGSRRPAAARRVPALRDDRQRDDRADERVHVRGDARGARGRHRGQARRPGARCPAPPARGRT